MLATDYKVDKSSWGDGPWQSEPDRVDFVFAGLACLALRGSPHLGHWCGYVGVPREHPLYGVPYDQTPGLEVHGGLTYSDRCSGDICHVPAPGMPDDVWWFGFDCGHAGDLSPGMEKFRRDVIEPALGRYDMREVYRELPYVRAEIEHLAAQLAAMMLPSHAPAAPVASGLVRVWSDGADMGTMSEYSAALFATAAIAKGETVHIARPDAPKTA